MGAVYTPRMLKNTLAQARALFARPARQRRAEPELSAVLSQALKVVDHADQVAQDPGRSEHHQALDREIETLRALVDARSASGTSPGLSDALRPLFRPGPGRHPKFQTTLVSHLGPTLWDTLRQHVVAGDLQALEAVRMRALESGQSAAEEASLEQAFLRLITHAVTQSFVREVETVQRQVQSTAALTTATERLSLAANPSSQGTKISLTPSPTESANTRGSQVAQAMTHVPPLPAAMSDADALAQKSERVPVTDGTKQTSDRHHYRSHPKRFLSRMQWADQSIVLTQTIVRGGYGKVRFGVQPNGNILVDKEYRVSKLAAARTGTKKTAESTLADICAEAVRSVRLRHKIEAHMPASHTAAARMRTKTRNFEIQNIVRIERPGGYKLHMLMSFEGIDLFDIVDNTPPAKTERLGALALSLAAQGYHELAQLHDHGFFCHLDLKPENFIYNEGGQIKVIDFGLAKPTKSGVSDHFGFRGTIIAPEMLDGKGLSRGNGQPLSTATDNFLMAITVIDVASRLEGKRFYGDQYTGSTGPERMQELFKDFYQWRNSLPRRHHKLVLKDIGERGSFGKMFAPLAKASPELCALLLDHALNEHPEKRWTAQRISQAIDGIFQEKQYSAVAEARPALDQIVRDKTQFRQLREEVRNFEKREARPRGENAIR